MSETDQENQAAGAENNQDTLLGGAPQEAVNRPSENPPEGGVQDRPFENGDKPQHPEIIRLFYRAGRSLSQDAFVGGKAAQADAQSIFSQSNMNP